MPTLPQRRCLVVDDDPIAATFLVELVSAQGLIVDSARSTQQADQCLAQRRFDILLVDRRLPDGDGILWLQKVLSLAGDGQTLRCLLTSGDLIDARELPSGVSQLRKPVDAERLCRWLANDPGPVAGIPDSTVPDALHKPICRSEVYVATGSSGASPVATYTSLLQQRRGSWPVGIFGTEKGTRADRAAIALLDDTAALPRLGGNRGALQSLRAMLLAELRDSAPWRQQLRLSTPPPAAIDALHRLRAACALTGCARLGQLGESIEAGLRSGTSTPAAALEDLDKVVADTISAISAQIE